MRRSYIAVEPSAINAYREKILHGNSGMTTRHVEQRIINHVKNSRLDENGLYPAHTRNGRYSSFFLAPSPEDAHRITDVLTVEEVMQF